MTKIFTVARGEFCRYFISPLAYVYLISFLLLNASFALYFGGILPPETPRCAPYLTSCRGFTSYLSPESPCACGQRSSKAAPFSKL